jgi:hypothetical protein
LHAFWRRRSIADPAAKPFHTRSFSPSASEHFARRNPRSADESAWSGKQHSANS